jgi:hypothetical protein
VRPPCAADINQNSKESLAAHQRTGKFQFALFRRERVTAWMHRHKNLVSLVVRDVSVPCHSSAKLKSLELLGERFKVRCDGLDLIVGQAGNGLHISLAGYHLVLDLGYGHGLDRGVCDVRDAKRLGHRGIRDAGWAVAHGALGFEEIFA